MIKSAVNSTEKPTVDEQYMRIAIDQARIAEENGDVPIGAVIVHNNTIIAKAYNQREQLQDPTAHAEIIALTQAASALENWHLNDCTIYVTLEPCCMCAGALVEAELGKIGGIEENVPGVTRDDVKNNLTDPDQVAKSNCPG